MLRAFIVCLALLSTTPATAAPEWRQARDYEVRLSSFDIEPVTMRFRAGEPIRLRLVNVSQQTHSFEAGAFFGRAQLRGRERRYIQDGKVIVPPNDVREIMLVPAAGSYRARAGSLFSRLMGMSSAIIVE
jgi:hypothetical protein